jgi:hypothetical protein
LSFLWDDEYKARVPTALWLRWICDGGVLRGDYFFRREDSNWNLVEPPQYYSPPSDPCPGYVTKWPEGVHDFSFNLPCVFEKEIQDPARP